MNLSFFRKILQFCFTRLRVKYIVIGFLVCTILDYLGAFTHILEVDFYSSFTYPLEGEIVKYVEQLKNNETPDVKPINLYNYEFLYDCQQKCKGNSQERLRIVFIVKSAAKHFDRRLAIRNTWGYEGRFSDVHIRTVFLLGVVPGDMKLQLRIDEEHNKFADIVQSNFTDTYFNNTIKTMMGFKWAITFCENSKFYMFSDDDMYISTKNVLRFVRNPTHYPEYLEMPVFALKEREKRSVLMKDDRTGHVNISSSNINYSSRKLNQVMDFELPEDVKLFAGYVFVSSPHRHRSSRWYVTLSEYPYHVWPPYVTAGAYVVSHDALVDLYYTSFYTKHFRFDDIYLGILAKKIDIEPYHCNEFYYYKKEYNIFNYHYVLASHGYDNPVELLKIWNEQRSSGNA